MWTYIQGTGELLDPTGKKLCTAYSGHGEGVNNPALQYVHSVGPIPKGKWSIESVRDSGNTGPFTIVLKPMKGTVTRGRGDFRIHGDNRKGDRSASHGCIIAPRPIREAVWNSGDRVLEVK